MFAKGCGWIFRIVALHYDFEYVILSILNLTYVLLIYVFNGWSLIQPKK